MKSILPFVFLLFTCTQLYTQTLDTAWCNDVMLRAQSLGNAGDINGSLSILTEALDTLRLRYGTENEAAVDILEMLGDAQRAIGNYTAAEPYISERLDICRKLYGDRDKRIALALLQLGYARFNLGRFETVEQLLSESKLMLEGLGMQLSREMTNVNSNLAAYYQSQGFYVKAEQLHLEAIRIERTRPDFSEINYAGLMNNIAVFYSAIQRSNEAIGYYDATLEILGKYVQKNHPYYLKSLESKGRALLDAGRYREAELPLKEALAIARDALEPDDAQFAPLLRGIALLNTKIGQYDEAIRLVKASQQLLEKQSGITTPEYITGLLNLATLYQHSAHPAQADSLLRQAIETLERENRAETTQYAQALTQLGEIQQQTQHLDLARPLLEKGARIGANIMGIGHPTYYAVFGEALVRQNIQENRPDSALQLLKLVRDTILSTYGERHERFIKMKTQYGEAWQLKGDALRSLQHFKIAFSALQSNLAENFRFLSVDEREKFARTFEGYRLAVLAAARTFPQEERFQAFLYDLTLFQKELLASYDRQLFAGWQQNPDSTYHRYTEVCQMIARQWTLPVAGRRDLPELESERTDLEKKLAGNSEITFTSDAFRPVQWQQVQQALQAGDAALEWLILPPLVRQGKALPCYGVLLLQPGISTPELVLLPATEQVDALFASKGSRGLQYATRTYSTDALYQALWKTLENKLSGVKRIFFAPVGALHLLNLGALQTPNGQLLSEKYQLVRVTNTARLLDAGFGQNIVRADNALLAGGLDYELVKAEPEPNTIGASWRGGSSVKEWAALPNTLPEVEHLADLLRQRSVKTDLLTGANGSETAVKAHCDIPRGILHFATHGFFFEKNTTELSSLGLVTAENPMFRSGLILAGANPAWRGETPSPGTLDDGILTADEISLLPLRNTALVVLSACETGLGDVHDDEGVYGLQRAFRLAGAQNIVMSLWRVPDVQTRQFMEKFYAALLENGELRSAFQNAREAMRKEYGNPYYWAGFVLLE